jgi:hypothetical protein
MKKIILYSFFSLMMSNFAFSQTQDTTNNYGTKVGFGLKILDGLGVSFRYYNSPKLVFDTGIGIGGYLNIKTDNNNTSNPPTFEYYPAPVLSAGFTIFGDRFEKTTKKNQKIRANGVAIRGNYLVGRYPTFSPSVGWAMETIRKNNPNRSFIFELGLKANVKNFEYDYVVSMVRPVEIYLRCHWNFFL